MNILSENPGQLPAPNPNPDTTTANVPAIGADAERARIAAALVASRGSTPARYRVTVWPSLPSSAGNSGVGVPRDLAAPEFVKELREDATKVIPKGQGVC